ncbi:MAG TPA: Dabb family protein [Pirellulaceae bacterium]|nr:Dabb family protein [Planctomycetales bacterium]HRX78249.1 Dabb family protein [Pirellulaceae bacterium]
MTQSHLNSSTSSLVILALGSLLVSLCAACSKPSTQTPPAITTSNTTEAATVSNDPEPEQDVPVFAPAPEGKVLRHAVFFSFKEESSEEDIQRIVDAFRELPSKIDEIIDFSWGTNNSPEGLNDGFTHCFLLTFQDEAGRAAYLPHEAHKAFGDVLRGHNDQVFVVDYWGNAEEATLEKKLKHAVFFRFKEDAKPEEIKKVEEAFAALPSKIDTIKDYEWGTNNSPEKHADGFTHCFMVTFDSEEGRAAYLPHADHLAFVEILKPILDAPRVMDFWAEK